MTEIDNQQGEAMKRKTFYILPSQWDKLVTTSNQVLHRKHSEVLRALVQLFNDGEIDTEKIKQKIVEEISR